MDYTSATYIYHYNVNIYWVLRLEKIFPQNPKTHKVFMNMTLQKVSLPDAIDMLTSNLANCIYIVSIFIISKPIGSYMSVVSICIAIIVIFS